jgi:hypothetical protein
VVKTLIENYGMHMNNNIQNLSKNEINGDIDEPTFIIWKSELQKELSSFWEIMNRY